MHPIVGQVRNLRFYLLAWLPLSGLIFYLFTRRGDLGWVEAAVLAFVLCTTYAFVCLSAWYTCRATPVNSSGFFRLVFTHLAAAALVSYFWVLLARGLGYVLSEFDRFHGLEGRVVLVTPLLLGTGILLYLLSVALHYVLLTMQESQAAEQREIEARVLARDAELKALKAQINPHFLFNSLHSISALTSVDPARAREMCLALSEFLRLTLGLGERATISLEEEMSLVHSFLAVEKIRFGERLRMKEEMPKEVMDCLMPPLILQPLIENAIKHGVANLPDGGSVELNIRPEAQGERLAITVNNEFDPDAPSRRKNGLGLANVRQRLEARYGSQARLSVEKSGEHFQVNLVLPVERKAVS